MSRAITSVVIIVLIIIIGISAIFYTSHICGNISESLDMAQTEVENNDFASALKHIEKADRDFEKAQKTLFVIFKHEYIDEVTEALLQLRISLENNDRDRFFENMGYARHRIEHLTHIEIPSIENIF